MLRPDDRFDPNENEVAAKLMDGEAILINLANGVYYSMDKAGGLIWDEIEHRSSIKEMIAAVTAHFDVAPSRAEEDILKLINELLENNLVSRSASQTRLGNEDQPGPVQKLSYEPPKLNCYTEMAALLALDPPLPRLDDTPFRDHPDDDPRAV